MSVLNKLKQEIPYKWKVQSARSWGCDCVAYIDARQVMDLLDEVMGPENWRDRYYSVGGSVYCEISLRIGDDWVSKSDAGSQSNFEAEKGQASDAFKRAAVKWGIGRFLYSMRSVRLNATENGTDDRGKPRYAPADDQGRKIRDLTAYIQSQSTSYRPKAPKALKNEPPKAPATNAPAKQKAKAPAAQSGNGVATKGQKLRVLDSMKALGWDEREFKGFLTKVGVPDFKKMTSAKAESVFLLLSDLRAEKVGAI